MPTRRLLIGLDAQGRRLRDAAEALAAFVAGPYPESFDPMMQLRWNFTREMLLYFARTDKELLGPLTTDTRPGIADRAARSSQDLAGIHGHFTRHVARWHAPPNAAMWPAYRHAIDILVRLITVRIAAQERDIYPLLPAHPGGPPRVLPFAPINYAAEAWKIRAVLPTLDAPQAAAG